MTHHPPFLTPERLDHAAVAAVSSAVASPERGAVVVFCGNVRATARHGEGAGRAVRAITYSAYVTMAEPAMRRICAEISAGEANLSVAITHRLGEIAAGETSVVIAAASPHREAAFAAARLALERLKKEVPVWKREHYADGTSAWREEEALGSPYFPGAASR